MVSKKKKHQETEQPLLAHLVELRDRLLRSLAVVFVLFLVLMPFRNEIFNGLAMPLLTYLLPPGQSIIATEVASSFLVPFKTVLMAAIFISVPFLLYQVWAFVAPGLYQHERRIAAPLLISSTLLFYIGMSFAYFVVMGMAFRFLGKFVPETVELMTDITHYYNFVLKMVFAFGVSFEVPVATFILVWSGIATVEGLSEKRPYIFIAAFVVGMLLTPPDVVSQFLLAVPMWLLFELGLLSAKYFIHKNEQDEAVEQTAEQAESVGEHGDSEYRPMTDQEMEDELERIEKEELAMDDDGSSPVFKEKTDSDHTEPDPPTTDDGGDKPNE